MNFSKKVGYLIWHTDDKLFYYVNPNTDILYKFNDITNLLMVFDTKEEAKKYLVQLTNSNNLEKLIIIDVIIEVKQIKYEFSTN